MKKMIVLMSLLMASQSFAAAAISYDCVSEQSFDGAKYRVLAESDNYKTADLTVAYVRNGQILGSDRFEDVVVYQSAGLRRIENKFYSIEAGRGQQQLTVKSQNKTYALVCK